MTKRKSGKHADKEQKEEKPTRKTVDPYTGEKTPISEDAGKVQEVVPVDSGDRSGENYLLKEETGMDHLAADEDADAVADRSNAYTEDEEIEREFEERQQLAVGGRQKLEEELEEHHSKSPKLSGGDLDAEWELADSGGEETVGGSTPTPDQDVVEELGEAVGLTYEDDEPLGGEDKLRKRDRERLEPDQEPEEEEQKDTDE